MKVISTNISEKRTPIINGESVETGMYKMPTKEGVYLTEIGVESDSVIDRRYHGGEEKACYIYGENNYAYFQDRFPKADWSLGIFGENITLSSLDEKSLNVGDVYQLGDAEIQITEPRLPCSKFGYRMGSAKAIKVFAQSELSGVYVRVLKPGLVRVGDEMELKKPWSISLKITELNSWLLKKTANADKLDVLEKNEAVSENVKNQFRKVNANQLVINKALIYVRELLEGDGSGHDWWHIKRVYDLAVTIAKEYPDAKLFIIQLGALLHDIGDHKFHNGNHTIGPKMVTSWLLENHVDENSIEKVVAIVKEISYKGAEVETPMSSLEGEIVQDADRLDAIGAIGIARTFAYGGNKNREMHNPEEAPELHSDFETYKKTTGPTINHFYEKLLLLKDRMNTDFGKKLAAQRHQYMEGFLEEFFAEWDGKK